MWGYTTSVRDDGLVQAYVTGKDAEVISTIQDNGRGIAAADLARLGQKFRRLAQGQDDPEDFARQE